MDGTAGGLRRHEALAVYVFFLIIALVYICLIGPLGPVPEPHKGQHVARLNPRVINSTSSVRYESKATAQTTRTRPLSCLVFGNHGSWEANFTTWKMAAMSAVEQKQKNAITLKAFLESASTIKPLFLRSNNTNNLEDTNRVITPPFQHLLFIGDSTMIRLYNNLPISEPLTLLKKSGRCGLLKYYGFQRAKKWIRPNATRGEGPIFYGLNNPFCTDCSGCDSMLQAILGQGGKEMENSYEYISVEFARDREQQTESTKTSQETLGAYLNKTYVRDLCVIGAGLHDVILNITSQQYTRNVLEFLTIIKPFCKQVVWLQTTATRNDLGQPQENVKLLQLNEAMLRLCPRLGPDFLILDLWNMSLPREVHVDNVHGTPEFYRELGGMFLEAVGIPTANKKGDVESA